MFYQTSLGPAVSGSLPFVCNGACLFSRLKGYMPSCKIDYVALLPSKSDQLRCARASLSHPESSFFGFLTTEGENTRIGKCGRCPSQYLQLGKPNPLADSWFLIQGSLLSPPELVEVPGILSVGRLLVITGKIPIPKPEKFSIGFYASDKATRVVGMTSFFHSADITMERRVRITSKVNGTLDKHNGPHDAFPFVEGQSFEISILPTPDGFLFFLDVEYLKPYTKTISMIEDINYFWHSSGVLINSLTF